jgi:allantoicase
MPGDAGGQAIHATPGPHQHGEPLTADSDLASRWLGASVMAASDEAFGEKENLLRPAAAAFEPGHYGNRGEIVDGWETRRRREPGHDWALVRLGTPGTISSVEVDTSFFTGNYPESCRVEACGVEGYPSPAELTASATEWAEIVPRSPLRGDARNTFPVASAVRFTHVRLSIFPDGGVARLRALGRVVPDPRQLDGLTVDLASQQYGGAVVASSDGFYTSARVLNRPDRARTMGEGWETRRRRDAGHDFVIFQLAAAGSIRQLVVDTAHFKYNASAEIAAFGSAVDPVPSFESSAWAELLPRTRLQPDTRHVFAVAPGLGALSAVRLDAFPDGGMSRVRVIGSVDPVARRHAGYRWFNALPAGQAIRCLAEAGLPGGIAAGIVQERPLPEDWLGDSKAPKPRRARRGLSGNLPALAALLEGRTGPA